MASKTAKIDLEVKVPPDATVKLDTVETKINDILTKANIQSKVSLIEDTADTTDTVDNYYITITFIKPIPFTDKKLKTSIHNEILGYLMSRYVSKVDPKDITPDSNKLHVYVDNVDKCTKIMYHYGFSLSESVSRLLKFVKKNDTQNSNKQLSKILKEKINNRLNKSLKK